MDAIAVTPEPVVETAPMLPVTALIEAAFQHALVGMAVLGTDGRWLHVNAALCALLGYTARELRATSYQALIVQATRDEDAVRLADLVSGHSGAYQLDRQLLARTGTWHWVRLSLSAIPGPDGRPIGVVCHVEDMEARRRDDASASTSLGELRRSNTELEIFASVAAHDLQEPLRKIRTFGDRLEARFADALDGGGLDYLHRMQASAERMQRLIDDLLIYARISTRGLPFEPVDLGRVATEVASDLEARLEEGGGRLDIGPLPTIEADPLQMRQLLQNLLGNALKFAATDRPPRVTVELLPAVTPDVVTIVVGDNGIGFDPIYARRIFEPFERLHGRSEYDGTGIGLAIARRVVERHGGTISADATPGEGARFTVSLPMHATGSVGLP